MQPASPTSEQYSLFRAYLDQRHADGGMVDMSVLDYAMMVEDSHVETRLVEYRRAPRGEARTAGCGLADGYPLGWPLDGLFLLRAGLRKPLARHDDDPRSHRPREDPRPAYLYLGYWVEGSKKMDYKARFLPQERLGMITWERVEK